MAKKRNEHEKKYKRRQVNMQLRFGEPDEVAAMDLITQQAKASGESESSVARDLVVAECRRRLKRAVS
jgi:hypothetical protein